MKFAITQYDESSPPTAAVINLPLPGTEHEANTPSGPMCALTPAASDAPITAIATDALVTALSTYVDPGDESDRYVGRALKEGQAIAITPSPYNDVTGRTKGQRLQRYAVLRTFNVPVSVALRESGLDAAPERLLLAPGSAYRDLVAADESKAQVVKSAALAKVKPLDPIESRKCPEGRFYLSVQDGAPLPPELEQTPPLWVDTRTGDRVFVFYAWEGFKVTPWVGGRRWLTVRAGEPIELPASLHAVAPLPDGRAYHVTREIRRRYHTVANTRRAPRPTPTLKHALQAKALIAKYAERCRHPANIYDSHWQDYLVQAVVNGCGCNVEWSVNAIDEAMAKLWAAHVVVLETDPRTGRAKIWYSDAGVGQPTTPPAHHRIGWQRAHIEDACAACFMSTDPADMEYGALVPAGVVERLGAIPATIGPWLRKLVSARPEAITSDELVTSLAERGVQIDGKNPRTHEAILEIMESQGYGKKKVQKDGARGHVFVPIVKPSDAALTEAARRYANAEKMIDGKFIPWSPPPGFGSNP
jgi:hypothetical protein